MLFLLVTKYVKIIVYAMFPFTLYTPEHNKYVVKRWTHFLSAINSLDHISGKERTSSSPQIEYNAGVHFVFRILKMNFKRQRYGYCDNYSLTMCLLVFVSRVNHCRCSKHVSNVERVDFKDKFCWSFAFALTRITLGEWYSFIRKVYTTTSMS